MNLAEGTVKVYLSRLFKKTKVRDRFELMLYRSHDRKLLSASESRVRSTTATLSKMPAPDYTVAAPVRAEVIAV